MLFHIKFKFSPEVRNATYDQFLETGGLPPEGVKMIGRWHDMGALEGYLIAETDNVALIGKWLTEWNDKLVFETVPVRMAKLREVWIRIRSRGIVITKRFCGVSAA